MPDDYYVSKYSGEEIDALLGGAGTGTVRYDAAQNLTDAQKTRARKNIDAAAANLSPYVAYFAVNTKDTKEKTFEVARSWRTYLVVSTYAGQLGMWMVLPNDNVVIPVVENSAITITCEVGKIHTKGAQVITIIYLGDS